MVLSCDDVPAEPLEPTGAAIGIDLGIASFLTTSDGTHVPNPRPLAATTRRLAVAQRDLAHKKRGSGRRQQGRGAMSRRCTARSAAQRLDHAHKTALTLVRDHDLIVHEDLQIANMTQRPKPRSDGNGALRAQRRGSQVGPEQIHQRRGWGVFLRRPVRQG